VFPPALRAKPDIARTPPYHFAICDRLIPDEPDMAIPFDHAENGRELTCRVAQSEEMIISSAVAQYQGWRDLNPRRYLKAFRKAWSDIG
jgi:hypothetical protein